MMSRLGQSITRVDARAKVTGEAKFPGDIDMPGQLWMKVLFANRPSARINQIDTTRAEQAPGVVCVLTAKDVPVNEYGLGIFDNPVLCDSIVRWIGDKVALVVAETEKHAAHARDLIKVEYEDLPGVYDPREAIKESAPLLHADHPGNILKSYCIRKGDVEKGLAGADVIVQETYHTPMQEHIFMQPEAGLAYIDAEGRVTVVVAGQWTYEDQQQIAHALDLPLDKVRVIYPAIGGAFGGREDMSVQIILALAAWKLNRPVKIIWSREESIQGHCKRHQMFIHARTGATREGKLVAAEVELIADAGAYCYTSPKVLGNATLTCTGPYEIPNVKVDAFAVYTNNVPGGAFRGFGAPQGHFVAESQMNKLAEKLGMDPVELRLKNLLRAGSLLSTQTPLPGGPVSLVEVTEACAKEFGWNTPTPESDRPHIQLGRGIASGFKNIGFSFGYQENSWAAVELHGAGEIEQAIVFQAGADVGQGAHTVMQQTAAETLDLSLDKIKLVVSDTAVTQSSGSVSASRLTYMSGNAIKGAAALALEHWRNEERPARAEYTYLAPPTDPYDPEDGHSKPNIAYGYLAQAVEVAVDTETGQVQVLRVTSAHDVGKALNRKLVEGQIEGGVIQSLGYAITENFVMKDGRVLTPYMSNYLIPGVLDIPDRIDSVILEYPDDNGPWGARGMAEMPFIALPAAIIAAVHDATGVWFNDFPLMPWKVLEGLKAKQD
ncbi:MAG: xanthine dehydrogenase family protein molybdopterin-binding subunit [Anaerolineae bacterium]